MSNEQQAITYPKVALILEGGGTRNSYTAPFIRRFIEEGLSFGWVGGVSAGAAHLSSLLSGDAKRADRSFVDFITDPKVGGFGNLLRGRGYFNSRYIYEEANLPGGALPFDWETFQTSSSQYRIGAVQAETGETVYWGREDITEFPELMERIRASSTMPGVMVMPVIDGVHYLDGAIGSSGGVVLDAALADNFDRFLVIHTRPRDFKRSPLGSQRARLARGIFRKYPKAAELMETRHERYNATKDQLFDLEEQGVAKLVFADDMPVSNSELNLEKLRESYRLGEARMNREWDSIMEFLQQTK